MLPAEASYANAVFLDSINLNPSTLPHEIMHVVLDAVHKGTNYCWIYNNTKTPWCIWYTGNLFGFTDEGILARKRIMDTMRSRLLKSKFCKDP